MEKPYYEVIVMVDPITYRRFKKPRKFQWKDREDALVQARTLVRLGLKKHHFEVWLRD